MFPLPAPVAARLVYRLSRRVAEDAGHPFHGNQYTDSITQGAVYDEYLGTINYPAADATVYGGKVFTVHGRTVTQKQFDEHLRKAEHHRKMGVILEDLLRDQVKGAKYQSFLQKLHELHEQGTLAKLYKAAEDAGHAFHGNQYTKRDSSQELTAQQKTAARDLTVYHGTQDHALRSIAEQGLRPDVGKGGDAYATQEGMKVALTRQGERAQSVYVTTDPAFAAMVGNYASLINPGSKPVVLKVKIPGDQVAKLKRDEKADASYRLPEHIPPSWIEGWHEIQEGDHVGSGFFFSMPRLKGELKPLEESNVFYIVLLVEDDPKTAEDVGHPFHGNQWKSSIGQIDASGSVETKNFHSSTGANNVVHEDAFEQQVPPSGRFRMKNGVVTWNYDEPTADQYFAVEDHFAGRGVKITKQQIEEGTPIRGVTLDPRKLRQAEEIGHPFHGNQWTDARTVDALIAQLPKHSPDSVRDGRIDLAQVFQRPVESSGNLLFGGYGEREIDHGTQTIPVEKLVPSQGSIGAGRGPNSLRAYLLGTSRSAHDDIQVAERDGLYHIRDGHHRAVAAILKGEKTIQADVYTFEPESSAKHLEEEGHEFHGNQYTSGSFSTRSEFTRAAVSNILSNSRTSKGIERLDAQKPKLGLQGSALARRTEANVVRAVNLAYDNLGRRFRSDEELQGFVEKINTTLNAGITDQLYRTHESSKYDYAPVSQIKPQMRAFVHELRGRLNEHDPIGTAAWVERRLNTEIHPFTDGVGRTTRVLAAFVLARHGLTLPAYHDQDLYQHTSSPADLERTYRGYFTRHLEEEGHEFHGNQWTAGFGHFVEQFTMEHVGPLLGIGPYAPKESVSWTGEHIVPVFAGTTEEALSKLMNEGLNPRVRVPVFDTQTEAEHFAEAAFSNVKNSTGAVLLQLNVPDEHFDTHDLQHVRGIDKSWIAKVWHAESDEVIGLGPWNALSPKNLAAGPSTRVRYAVVITRHSLRHAEEQVHPFHGNQWIHGSAESAGVASARFNTKEDAQQAAREAHQELKKAGFIKQAREKKAHHSEKMGRSEAYSGGAVNYVTHYAHADGRSARLLERYPKYGEKSIAIHHERNVPKTLEEEGHEFHGNQWTGAKGPVVVYVDPAVSGENESTQSLQESGKRIGEIIGGRDGATVNVDERDYETANTVTTTISSNEQRFSSPSDIYMHSNAFADRKIQFGVQRWKGKDPTATLDFVEFHHPVPPSVAKGALRETIAALDREHVKSLRVDASLEDGGYLWARLGFKPVYETAFRKEITTSMPINGITGDARKALNGILETSGKDIAQRVADFRFEGKNVGRQALKNVTWEGAVKMNDPEFRRRLNHFVGRS